MAEAPLKAQHAAGAVLPELNEDIVHRVNLRLLDGDTGYDSALARRVLLAQQRGEIVGEPLCLRR